MQYEIKDTTVYGKVLAQKGKPVITNYDNAMKLAERFRGTLQKTLDKRYMIKLPETATTIEECDCQSQPTGEPMPQTYNQYPDHEVQMARQELYRSAKLALMIHDLLKNVGENQGLEGWVQRKITRAADYIESVFDYLDYEMRYPSEMTEAETMQVTPQNPNQPKTGGAKKPPGLTQTPGMVKMAKIDANGNVQGVPVMVPAAQVKSKQQSGFHVIGESASAGASSAGGIAAVATPMGGMISRSGVGSLFGGTYKQKKSKKKVAEYQLNELDLYAPVTTFIKMRDGSYIQADWRRHQYTKGLADRASFISFKPVNPSVVKQLGLDNINALRKSGRSTGEITQGADYQQGGPMGDRKFDVVDFSDRSIDDIPDNLKIALVKWIQNKGVSEDVEDKKTGPKFTGYWKGKDKGKPGNKMVGSD